MGPHGTQVKNPTTGKWGPQREPPPPTAAATPCACVVLASCLRHACYKGKTTRATRGTTVAGCRPPPPEDTAAGWGCSGKRVRDEPHDRAQRKHAPCKPQRGNHRGCDRRKGRVMTGATWQAAPPAQGQVLRLVPAPCLRRAYARGRTARTPPPPTPFSSTHPRKGRGQRGDSEGTWGGGGQRTDRNAGGRDERRAKKKKKKQRTPTRQSRGRQQGQTGHGGSQEARQGARERGTPLGTKARRQGPTPQRTGGDRGDKSLQRRW